MAVVRLGLGADLRPFEAHERDEIGIARIAGDGVALTDRLLRLAPVRGRQGLGVIGEREEVERRAEAGEVAGVGERVHALAVHEGDAAEVGVRREGGVDVEIAEEDLLGVAGGDGGVRVRVRWIVRSRVRGT